MPEGPTFIILKETVQQFKCNKIIKADGNSKKPDINLLKVKTIIDFKTRGKHWLAHTKTICPRDHVRFHKAILGKAHRCSFFCDMCQVLYI